MKDIKSLRNELVDVFAELRARNLTTKEAKELINCAGKIIMSAKTELDYNKFMKNGKQIDFLESDE
jgi:hypothetical protein